VFIKNVGDQKHRQNVGKKIVYKTKFLEDFSADENILLKLIFSKHMAEAMKWIFLVGLRYNSGHF